MARLLASAIAASSASTAAFLIDVTHVFILVFFVASAYAFFYFIPGDALAPRIQQYLDNHRKVRMCIRLRTSSRWEAASDLSLYSWATFREIIEKDGIDYRKANGRGAGSPKVSYWRVIAYSHTNGSRMDIALAGSGGASAPNPRKHMEMILESGLSPAADVSSDITQAGLMLERLIDHFGAQPGGHALLTADIPSEVRGDVEPGSRIETITWSAALKWHLLSLSPDRRAFILTDVGRTWYECSPTVQASRAKKRLNSGRRTQVTKNYFQGPTNYVHGINEGSMHANDYRTVMTPQILAKIQELLDSPDIPWEMGELCEVHRDLSVALDDKEPGRAKQAIFKLGEIAEQLALGISGNAAYSLLVAHFSK